MMEKHKWFLLASSLLVGCTMGPDYNRPAISFPSTYTAEPLTSKTASSSSLTNDVQYFAVNQRLTTEWWLLFHCVELNDLIVKSFKNNPSIHAAQAALQQAKENLATQKGSLLYPQIDLTGNAQRQRTNSATFGSSQSPASVFNLFNSQVNVSYSLDIFGSTRRTLESLRAQVDYQQYELEATYLTLAANIATTAISEASVRQQIEATQQQIKIEKKILSIVKKQFKLGAATKLDILTQTSQLAQTKASLPPLEKNLTALRHSLAALIGEFPYNAALPIFTLDKLHLPRTLPIDIPSELVKKRPDIKAAEAILHQASAEIGIATANLFPQITLTGNYGWESDVLSQLFNSSTSIWSYAGQMLQPLMHGGELLAKRRAAIAAYQQSYFQYYQTILQAFQNVADALKAIEMDAKTLQSQLTAENAAWDTWTVAQHQFQIGAASYLLLLENEKQYLQAYLNRVQAEAARYTDSVALFQALGGWDEVFIKN